MLTSDRSIYVRTTGGKNTRGSSVHILSGFAKREISYRNISLLVTPVWTSTGGKATRSFKLYNGRSGQFQLVDK
jgi:hypothetical protein